MPRPPHTKPTPKPKAQGKNKEKPSPGPTAQRIIKLRGKEGLTQTQMSERLDQMALSSYVRIESGVYRPSIDLLEMLMEKFGCTPYDLLVPPKVAEKKLELLRELVAGLDTCSEDDMRSLIRHASFYKDGKKIVTHYAEVPREGIE